MMDPHVTFALEMICLKSELQGLKMSISSQAQSVDSIQSFTGGVQHDCENYDLHCNLNNSEYQQDLFVGRDRHSQQ